MFKSKFAKMVAWRIPLAIVVIILTVLILRAIIHATMPSPYLWAAWLISVIGYPVVSWVVYLKWNH